MTYRAYLSFATSDRAKAQALLDELVVRVTEDGAHDLKHSIRTQENGRPVTAETPLGETSLGQWVRNRLVKAGFATVGQLAQAGDDELMAIQGVKQGNVSYIRDWLAANLPPSS